MKKRFIMILIFILLGVALLYIAFLAPYNLREILIGQNLKDVPEVSQYFKDYDMRKIQYLGNGAYEVSTNRDSFIIIADYSVKYADWKYKIFKYDKDLVYLH